jgi:hypothetical protein
MGGGSSHDGNMLALLTADPQPPFGSTGDIRVNTDRGTIRRVIQNGFWLTCFVLVLTQAWPAQDKPSKIPEGEAQFTPEQLEEYYQVYKNADVRYLRIVFNNYLNGSGISQQERQLLDKWDKRYFRSKFIVMSRDDNTFGGTLITILFQDRPDEVFVAWVYPEGISRKLTLRKLDRGDFSEEDIRRINIRYKKLIQDKVHAM